MIAFFVAVILLVSGSDGACADPISALIVGAIGLTGTAATIGTAVLDIGLAVGLSYAANALKPKTKTASTRGQSINLTIDTSPYRKVPVGQRGLGGDLVYWQLFGNNNDTLQMVIALGDIECDSLVTSSIFVNGVQQTIDGSGNVSGFSNKLQVFFYNGDPAQAAAPSVVSNSGGRWTSNEVGKNVCYVVVWCQYDEKVFSSGIPQIVFVLRGAKLYDWRKDGTNGGSGSQRWADQSTWAYSDNPVVVLYNVLRGIAPGGVPLIGMRVPAPALRLADFTAAANACDETISLAAGGTEKRYRISAVFDTSMTNRDIIETILSSCAGELIESCGIYRPIVGVAQTSVADLTDSDLIVTEPFQSDPKRPRSDLTNAVYGTYSDPTRSFNSVALPNRTSSDDEAEDGGQRLPQTLDLTMVTSRSQAQRIMEIARKRARRQLQVSLTLRSRWFVLEPGDWVTFNSDRRGYSDRTFEVASVKIQRDLTSIVSLQETDAAIDDWSTSDELADNTATDLASAGPGLTTVTGIVVTTIVAIGDSGAQVPALGIQWDAITDPTVSAIKVEYRKVGDTISISDVIQDPSTGGVEAFWKGVQGKLTYEARLQLVTVPARSVDWSSWVTASDPTQPAVIDTAAIALGVPPDTITPEMLSAQARLALEMATALADVQGSVQQRLDDTVATLRGAISAIAGISAKNTQLLRSVRAETDGNSIGVTEVLEALNGPNGLLAQWSIAIDENGNVTGLVSLSGDTSYTQFSVLADKIVFAMPDGTGQKQIITVGLLADGTTGVGIDAESVIFKGTIKAEHIDVVSLATLRISDPDNKFYYNFATGAQGATDGTFLIDAKNKVLDFSTA